MKNISLILAFLSCWLVAQAQKSMTFEQAKAAGLFERLDTIYSPGIDTDTSKAVFKDEKAYISAYQEFIAQFSQYLAKNKFKWGKQTRCFNKIYFSKSGKVDYFLYNFKEGEISETQAVEFERLLKKFIKKAKFKLKPTARFSQCSPVKYADAN